MHISVIIVSYNTRELLANCLASLAIAIKSLPVGQQAEIIVSDNHSFDGSADMVRKEFPEVKIIENKENLGFSRANNIAIKNARGKYILILNPDTETEKETIGKMISFMEKRPEVGIATCKVELPNGQLDRDCRRHFPTPWRAFCHFTGLSKVFPKSKIFDQYYMGYSPDDIEHEVDACSGAFMMIRKSAIDKVGLFDEDFFFYGEDLDWCWRFNQAGYKIIYTPITKITHYKGVSSGIKKDSQHLSKATRESKRRALRESVRAMKLFYQKHYQGKYPIFVDWLMFVAIWILEKYRLLKA